MPNYLKSPNSSSNIMICFWGTISIASKKNKIIKGNPTACEEKIQDLVNEKLLGVCNLLVESTDGQNQVLKILFGKPLR